MLSYLILSYLILSYLILSYLNAIFTVEGVGCSSPHLDIPKPQPGVMQMRSLKLPKLVQHGTKPIPQTKVAVGIQRQTTRDPRQ